MPALTSSHFHGNLPIILNSEQGYPTGDGELDEIEFDVLCPAAWQAALTDLELVRGKLLPDSFPYHAMFIHAMAPITVSKDTVTIKVICKGLIADYNKEIYETGYEEAFYIPPGGTARTFAALPAIIITKFVTTKAEANDLRAGANANPPRNIPEPYGGYVGREWVEGRQYSVQIYQGATNDAIAGLWKTTKALWYVPSNDA